MLNYCNKKNKLLSSVMVLTLLGSIPVYANPSMDKIVSGEASVVSSGFKTDIYQNTDKVIIDWRSFDLNTNEHTQFHQPSSSSIALNRINDVKASQIDGRLTANGHIMLINQNGIVFGSEAQIDVGSLTASIADINNSDFMNGNMIFNKSGLSNGKIINNGIITVRDAGLINLVAPQVDNNGIIYAKMGKVQLAATDNFTIDLAGDGLIQIAVNDTIAKKIIKNTGTISANGGFIALTTAGALNIVDSLIDSSGIIEASSLVNKGGKITFLSDGGTINISGIVDASGKIGGGEILIGGDYQGKKGIITASNTNITDIATIKANATDTGNGGKVIVWSDNTTIFAGSIEATAGVSVGNGGFVETSGKQILVATGRVDASAKNGKAGQWLLDPNNITIQDAGPNSNVTASPIFNSTDDNAIVTTASIEAALNGGTSVTVQTTSSNANTQDGDITVANDIDKTSGGDATLTLKADNSIFMSNVNITSTAGALSLVLNSDADNNDAGAISLTNTNITTNGGDFIAGGGLNPLTDYAYGTTANYQGVLLNNSDIITGAGDISIRGHGQDNAGLSTQYGIYDYNTSVLQTTTGDITLNGVGGVGDDNNQGIRLDTAGTLITSINGNITLTGVGGSNGGGASRGNYGVHIYNGADIVSTGIGANSGDINITGTGGDGYNFNFGFLIYGTGSSVSTVDGAVNITGIGGSNGAASSNSNTGLSFNNGLITSTGNSADTKDITMNATGGAGLGSYNYGLYSVNGTTIQTTVADINITSTAGAGDDNNRGIYFSGSSISITSVDGDITLTGTGGSSGGTNSDSNVGIYLLGGMDISSTGTGANAGSITLNGTGGAGAASSDNNYGLYITDAGTTVTSVDGNISLNGTGNGGGINNNGTNVYNNSAVITTGSADISIWGNSLTTGNDINIQGGTINIGGGGATGNFIFTADTYNFPNLNLQTSGNMTMAPRTVSSSIGVSGGAGAYTVSDTTLAFFNNVGGNVIIGDAVNGTGLVTVDGLDVSATGYGFELHGGAINVDNGLDTDTNLTLIARQGDVTLNSAVSTNGNGNSVIISANGNFINNVGAGAIDVGTGRSIIYSSSPATVSKNGLTGTNYYNRTYTSNAPATIPGAADSFVYAYQPTLNFTADDISISAYDDSFNTFTYNITGLETGDILGNIYTGTPVFSKTQTLSDKYDITPAIGDLASITGYGFNFIKGELTMPPLPQPVTNNKVSKMNSNVLKTIQNPKFFSFNNKSNGQNIENISILDDTLITDFAKITQKHKMKTSSNIITSNNSIIKQDIYNYYKLGCDNKLNSCFP